MNAIFVTVLSMSLAASLLIGVLLLGEFLTKRKMNWSWKYWLWVLILIRLLVPGSFLVPADTTLDISFPLADMETSTDFTENVDELESSRTSSHVAVSVQESWPRMILENVWLIWLIGALILFISRLASYRSYKRCLLAGTTPCSDVRILDLCAAAGDRLHLRRPVEVGVNPLTPSPLILGLRHPTIILPDLNYSSEELECIVMHELVHLKRIDSLYKWVVQLAVCVHWFNPLVHLMDKRISQLCELSCDEAVIRVLGKAKAHTYSITILKAAAGGGAFDAAVGTVELAEGNTLLKERIMHMKGHARRKPKSLVLGLLLLIGLFACGACTRVYTPWEKRSSATSEGQGSMVSKEDSASELESLTAPAAKRIALNVQNAWVRLEPTEEDALSVSYNPRLYQIEIAQETDSVYLDVEGTNRFQQDASVTVYMPSEGIESLETTIHGGAQTGLGLEEDFHVDNMNIEVNDGFAQLNMYPDLASEVTIKSTNSCTALVYEGDFAGTDFDLDATNSVVLMPSSIDESSISAGHYEYHHEGAGTHAALSAQGSLVVVREDGVNVDHLADFYDIYDRWARGNILGTAAADNEDLGLLPEIPDIATADSSSFSSASTVPSASPASDVTGTPTENASDQVSGRSGRGRSSSPLTIRDEVVGELSSALSAAGQELADLMEEIGAELREALVFS